MESEHILYLTLGLGVILLICFTAYMMRDRLTSVRLKHGKSSAQLGGEQRPPGVVGEGITSRKGEINLEDQTGAGVRGTKLDAEKNVRLTNAPPKP